MRADSRRRDEQSHRGQRHEVGDGDRGHEGAGGTGDEERRAERRVRRTTRRVDPRCGTASARCRGPHLGRSRRSRGRRGRPAPGGPVDPAPLPESARSPPPAPPTSPQYDEQVHRHAERRRARRPRSRSSDRGDGHQSRSRRRARENRDTQVSSVSQQPARSAACGPGWPMAASTKPAGRYTAESTAGRPGRGRGRAGPPRRPGSRRRVGVRELLDDEHQPAAVVDDRVADQRLVVLHDRLRRHRGAAPAWSSTATCASVAGVHDRRDVLDRQPLVGGVDEPAGARASTPPGTPAATPTGAFPAVRDDRARGRPASRSRAGSTRTCSWRSR